MALVARIPESVSLSSSVQSAPANFQDSETRASILVVQSTWHLAFGRSVNLAAHVDARTETSQSAALIRLRKVDEPVDASEIPAFGFLPRPALTRVDLQQDLNPRLGRQTLLDGLLVLRSADSAQPQTVFITVTAL